MAPLPNGTLRPHHYADICSGCGHLRAVHFFGHVTGSGICATCNTRGYSCSGFIEARKALPHRPCGETRAHKPHDYLHRGIGVLPYHCSGSFDDIDFADRAREQGV